MVIQSKTLTVDDPAFRSTIADTLGALRGFKQVKNLRSPLAAGNSGQISPDRHAVLVTFKPHGSYEDAVKYIDTIAAKVAGVQKAHPDLYVGEAGVSTDKALDNADQLGDRAGGADRPAADARHSADRARLGGRGACAAGARADGGDRTDRPRRRCQASSLPMDPQVNEVILLIGLAVGVDYSLFYLRREREERRAGGGEQAALQAAAATSGRAVLISGFTVMVAMAGMFFSGDKTFMSFGIGTMLVVAVAMLGSLTVLPAVLSMLGDRVEKGRIPFLDRFRRDAGEGSRIWGADPAAGAPPPADLRRRSRRPCSSGWRCPRFTCTRRTSGVNALPKSLKELQAFHALDDAFPGGASGAVGRDQGEGRHPAPGSAIAELKKQALGVGRDAEPDHRRAGAPTARRSASTSRLPATARTRCRTTRSPRCARTSCPRRSAPWAASTYAVTGPTAHSVDFNEKMKSAAPFVFGFVLLFAFLLLLAAFRSLVDRRQGDDAQPAVGGAAYGILVAVFQWGWGENLLDFNSTGGIASWLPMFLFVILFGLSMDYHVFILSRIREAFDRGLSTEEAVEQGIRTTAGVVTGAAVVMVARVQRLRHPAAARPEGDGHRPGGRHPDRRHHRPGRAAAGDDEAARRRELVPAELAAVAAPPRARRRHPGAARVRVHGLTRQQAGVIACRSRHAIRRPILERTAFHDCFNDSTEGPPRHRPHRF